EDSVEGDAEAPQTLRRFAHPLLTARGETSRAVLTPWTRLLGFGMPQHVQLHDTSAGDVPPLVRASSAISSTASIRMPLRSIFFHRRNARAATLTRRSPTNCS